ncbi:hypothetical protein M407DRAFT_244441 [Tulasnella calospora MUT 4182]|uniref:Uncharacterized protein n=1 Tax=Tulasnella calospora MUT 4182 TaxID=1051891 RepID=A0A0C3QG77_9AGAM|nr:hypothetical protein M407DRAFT_244441 [Tulasnella calospora MUT 4182]
MTRTGTPRPSRFRAVARSKGDSMGGGTGEAGGLGPADRKGKNLVLEGFGYISGLLTDVVA